jgi:SAM-dependent methyltransferase
MRLLDLIHGNCVHPRRVRKLGDQFARFIPTSATVLDVGCGDGQLARLIGQKRPDLRIQGIEVLVRPDAAIPVTAFDGQTIPLPDASIDVVMFSDVLHHAKDPLTLLSEARRVARLAIVIKDHLLQGMLAGQTLAFMDRVGNARHGVALPYHYWTPQEWRMAFEESRLHVEMWDQRLGLYPFPASLLFERSLHFLARLTPA